MVMGYWSVAILFWQLSIDHIVNVQCKRCGLAKTRLRHPSLPFDSLPYPTHTICRRVRTYARSITWQPNEKRLTIFYEYGALSHARFVLRGSPFRRRYYMQTISKYNILLFSSSYSGSFISHFLQIFCLVSTQYSKFLWKGTQFRAIFQVAKRGDSIFDHFYVNYPVSSLKTINNNKKNEYKKRRERKKKGNLGAKGEKHKQQLRHGFPWNTRRAEPLKGI